MKKIFFLILCIIQSVGAEDAFIEWKLGQDIELIPHAPTRYVVKQGDDFTKVMKRFVEDLDLLQEKLKLDDEMPSLSPGDTVILAKSGHQYRLQIRRQLKSDRRLVRLSPKVRVIEQTREPPTIPIGAIQQFFNRPEIITLEELENAGYIFENPKRTLMVTKGDQIYVRRLEESPQDKYIIVRLGQPYRSSTNGDILAYEAIYLGSAKLDEWGDPTILTITSITREILPGDRLLPIMEQSYEDLHPHPPEPYVVEDAKIIAVAENTSRIGQYQVVAIDRGLDDGMEMGHTLQVRRGGNWVIDTISEEGEMVKLPSQHAGTLLVFKPFDAVSYALVMEAVFPIKLFDEVVAAW